MTNLFTIACGLKVPQDTPSIITFSDFDSYEEFIQFLEDEQRMNESEEFLKGEING